LKNFLNTTTLVQQQTSTQFNFDDITNALFYNKKPVYFITPFRDIIKYQIIIPTYLSLFDKNTSDIYTILKSAVQNDQIYNYLLKLPAWMLGRVIKEYKEGIEKWEDYIINNLEKYCETFESKLKWTLVKTMGVNTVLSLPLSLEQSLWIFYCSKNDEKEKIELMIKLRDSLLPWINPELWDKVQKQKENARFNSAYEKIHKQILEELDIIK
jgi:hypothetical protein